MSVSPGISSLVLRQKGVLTHLDAAVETRYILTNLFSYWSLVYWFRSNGTRGSGDLRRLSAAITVFIVVVFTAATGFGTSATRHRGAAFLVIIVFPAHGPW